MNSLQQLRKLSRIVADTGDFQIIQQYSPEDATTNPSLILKAAQKKEYQPLLAKTLEQSSGLSLEAQIARLIVNFGIEFLKIIPGRVSSEIDARLSFDTLATIKRAQNIIALYEENGISRSRVLIKIAATWEGIRAAEILQQEGINCNMTLLFSLVQAAACAEAKVKLISPFVGRIYDWHKKSAGSLWSEPAAHDDPGVQSVQKIYAYYRKFGYQTEIMAASFRNIRQIKALAGCHLLTISPDLLQQLQEQEDPVSAQIERSDKSFVLEKMIMNETAFNTALRADAMATEKLAEGIRLFSEDTKKLEEICTSFYQNF